MRLPCRRPRVRVPSSASRKALVVRAFLFLRMTTLVIKNPDLVIMWLATHKKRARRSGPFSPMSGGLLGLGDRTKPVGGERFHRCPPRSRVREGLGVHAPIDLDRVTP